MTQRKAEALIALGLTLRGTSLLFSKLAMQTIGPFTLCGIRFLISFAVVALIFHKQIRSVTKKEVLHSAIVGFLYFCCMAFELLGLRTTPSSTTAFIENTSVVIVPLLAAIVYRRLPKRMDILCALIALAGIAFMTLKGSKLAFTPGELLIFCDAVSYAITVVVMDIVTVDDNALNIGVFHLFFIGFFSLLAAFAFEDFTIPTSAPEWGAILYLALVCGAIGFTIQPVCGDQSADSGYSGRYFPGRAVHLPGNHRLRINPAEHFPAGCAGERTGEEEGVANPSQCKCSSRICGSSRPSGSTPPGNLLRWSG